MVNKFTILQFDDAIRFSILCILYLNKENHNQWAILLRSGVKWLDYICMNLDTNELAHACKCHVLSVSQREWRHRTRKMSVMPCINTTKIIVVKCFITYCICEISVIFAARNSENEFECGILDQFNSCMVTSSCLTLYCNIWWNDNNVCKTWLAVLGSLGILNFGRRILALLLCKNRNEIFIFIFRAQLFEAWLS